ncbi:tubulin polyglutamylase TTLL5 [Elysia marginata]|uniref:Tubulin--tyrosine ligase-like protein 9 n=1 Tax=Elysia marginata TaxID=1093978 RepID=A0AAV4FN98_9GAST|nr:tubulin polyglutamylase TTLL5 [Elysia marginata]
MPRPTAGKQKLSERNIRFRCSLQNTILDVLRARPGWIEVSNEGGAWDFYWADVWWMKEIFDRAYLEDQMRLNHFRNHYEVGRNPGTIWIMKPIAKSQGKGIFLFKKLKDITDWKRGVEYQPQLQQPDGTTQPIETYVVQRYIENPYLIGGRKFDIRIYVLVTSVSITNEMY